MLEIDGVAIVQTGAILRYVARIGDTTLYPADPSAAIRGGRLDGLTEALLEPYPRLRALTDAYLQDARVNAYSGSVKK